MSRPEYISAAVLTHLGAPLQIIDNIKVPILKRGQVLVKVNYAGVCHSQLMEARGKRGRDAWLPHLLGHEGTGKVIRLGEGVSKVKINDSVVLSWIKSSGIEAGGCQFETSDGMIINAGSVTTFSNYTVVSENRLVLLPEGTPEDIGVLYGCALPTGAGIVLNEIKLNSESTIGVIGLGGVGMSALMAASLFSPKILMAIDVEDSKLTLAQKLGATHSINSKSVDPIKVGKELTGGKGFDYIVEASGLASTIMQGFEMVRREGGRCIFASHPAAGEKICIDPYELICGKKIQGSWGGASCPDRDVPLLGQYYKEGKLKLNSLLSHTYTLDTINQALNDLENRKITRALVSISPTH